MKWFARRRGKIDQPVELTADAYYKQLEPDAFRIIDQLRDHHHDGDWPTSIGWYLPDEDEEPPWEALDELHRSGYCIVKRNGDEVSIDFTDLGRRAFT